MRLNNSLTLKLKAPFRSLWFVMWNHATDRFKRMCLLTSLHAQLVTCDEKDHHRLEAVNLRLDLDRNTSALKFPTLIGPLLWKQVLPIEKIDMERSEVFITRVIKRSPCWLLYADDRTIREDIRNLLNYCRGAVGAH